MADPTQCPARNRHEQPKTAARFSRCSVQSSTIRKLTSGSGRSTVIGLGSHSLRIPAERGQAYALAVERLKDLPYDNRIALLESLIAALAAEFDGDIGPFRLLSWEEARALPTESQVTIYPHTLTHPILSRCTDDKVEREIADSCAAVQQQQHEVQWFSPIPTAARRTLMYARRRRSVIVVSTAAEIDPFRTHPSTRGQFSDDADT
jgi:hypothetical protein